MRKYTIATVGFVGAGALLFGCADAQVMSGGGGGAGGGGGNAGSSGINVNTDATVIPVPLPTDPGQAPIACDNDVCTDFPSEPIIDGKDVPQNPSSQFSGSPSGNPPCVVEPEDGSLFPYNWLRPRIKWTGTSGLVQITVHADLEKNDMVAYTTSDHWLVPKDVWAGLAKHVHESDVTVTVRAAGGGATTVKFQIASASAAGKIVFWAADPAAAWNQDVDTMPPDTASSLKGFSVGEDNTIDALKLSQVKQVGMKMSYGSRRPTCMGCHSATPDEGYVAFNDNWPWGTVIAGVSSENVGAALTNLSGGGLAALNKPWAGPATFNKSNFWQTGRRILVTTSAQSNDAQPWANDSARAAQLVWYNLDSAQPSQKVNDGYQCVPGQQYGVIARNGDSNGAAFATWSHDGSSIVYSSTRGGCQDGRLQQGATDLYSVPYNNGEGGDAKPVPGASEKDWEEYYAAYSPDDRLMIFDRVKSGEVMYANANAEIFVVPMGSATGAGKAIRLRANDPVQCTGKSSPGINNHFPKWAPAAQEWKGRTYYWVVFSSNRAGLPKVKSSDGKEREVSQLYLTAISIENGQYTTYPSIYLWNQPTKTLNTTPVWDLLQIPPAPPIY